MKTIGERINTFENSFDHSVEAFNKLFTEVPLTGFNNNDTVVIGDIASNATTRNLTINNQTIEHSFIRRSASENDYTDYATSVDNDDDDWMFYFV